MKMEKAISELQKRKTRILPNLIEKMGSRVGVDREAVETFLRATKNETVGETCDRLDVEKEEKGWSETTVTAIRDALLETILAESYIDNFIMGNGNLRAYARLERGVRRI